MICPDVRPHVIVGTLRPATQRKVVVPSVLQVADADLSVRVVPNMIIGRRVSVGRSELQWRMLVPSEVVDVATVELE